MNERIAALSALTLNGDMHPKTAAPYYDRMDLFLPESQRDVKRLCAYILHQSPVLTPHSKMTGLFLFDGSVVGDAFKRGGHRHTSQIMQSFYCKPIDNLSTMEWQHATADYEKVLTVGIRGILAEIESSFSYHSRPEERMFLEGLKQTALTMITWAHKCSAEALAFSHTVADETSKGNLIALSQALLRVPEYAPQSFYEAVLTIYLCFSADPDSVGTLDRYLTPFYEADYAKGVLTKDEAREYLQELFLMLQSATPVTSSNFTRGGESHFCIGGYLPNGEDGFNDLSRLILESLIDLPTYIPQVTLRWTAQTPREVLRFAMDCERRDPHKRIAFQNDEKRMKCYTEICGIPFEKAVGYTTVGCNEPAFLGGIAGSNSKGNFARSMETIFHKKSDLLKNCPSYEEFYTIYLEELFSDLLTIYECDDRYNAWRAKDINYISSLFFNDCIANAKSCTAGGNNTAIASPTMMGITNVIDSLIVIKQFVYDEKCFSMDTLTQALQANWEGFDDLHRLIIKKGDFFGNDTPRSNAIAQQLYRDLHRFLKGKKNIFGYQWLIGDLMGYNVHHKWFGEKMEATPDGRYRGESLKFGLGQSEGKDRNGLTALLNAIAKVDPAGIGCGSTVTNVMIDEQLIQQDSNFEKTVDLFEAYFKKGGVHFQLTYVSREDLLHARCNPEQYRNLRVRVSGFSDYYTKLNEAIQDDIIARTSHAQ